LSRLRKYLALTPSGRAIILRSLLLLPIVAVLLRTLGMARTTALLERLGRHAEGGPDTLAPQEIARLIHAAASILGAPCLPRALVLSHFLHCRGTPAEIRFGVTKLADGKLSAHAWVELDGLPLDDRADVFERYATLPSSATQFRVDHP